jgi:hypothetical protein
MQQFAPWILLALAGNLAACGEVAHGGLPDAAPSQDAPVDPPAVTATVLTNTGDGAPDLTAKVLFQDADGSVVADGPVDAMGHAQALLPRGGTVSAIRIVTDTPNGLSAIITTTTGVKPGDDLVFGLKPPGTITNQGGDTTMTVSFTPPDAGASYTFYTACGSAASTPAAPASPMTLHFRDSCHGPTFDLLVVASGGKLASPQFARLTNITYANGGSFAIPGVFTTMASFTVNMTNIADAVSNLTVTRASMIDSTVAGDQTVAVGDPPAGAVSVTLPFAQGFETRSQIAIATSRPDATGTQQFETHTPALSATLNVDLGTLQVPWITSLAMKPTGATWSTVVPGDAPDGMVTTWGGRWNDGTRPFTIAWRVVQPVEASGMTLPKLPATYAMLDPGQQTVAVTPFAMILNVVDYDTVAGYDEFRRMPETLISPIATLGAFINKPFQRRMLAAQARAGVAGPSGAGGLAADLAQ